MIKERNLFCVCDSIEYTVKKTAMKKLLCILLLSLLFIQCNSDEAEDCSLVLCAAPELLFEFIDEATGDNILEGAFDNGAPEGFLVTVGEDMTPLTLDLQYIFENGQVFVFPSFIGENQVQISLENVFDVAIVADVEILSDEECCSGYQFENITVTNATFEQVEDNSRLILRIFI